MLEGEGNREVFGSNKVELIYTVNVKEFDNVKKRVLLDAGKVHGYKRVHNLPYTLLVLIDFSQTDKRIAIVEIDELRNTDSYALIVHELRANQKIEEGSQAVLIDSGTMNIKKKVRLVIQHNNKQIPITKQKEALNKIKNILPK